MWYGVKKKWGGALTFSRNLLEKNRQFKKNQIVTRKVKSKPFRRFCIFLPKEWEAVVLTSQKSPSRSVIYIYSVSYYFKLLLGQGLYKVYYSPSLKLVSFTNSYSSTTYALYQNTLAQMFITFNKVWFKKLKIKGKGYYLYKNLRNTFTYQFGHSHRLFVYAYYVSVKFLSKTTVFLFGLSKKDILRVGYSIFKLKALNIFTGRGVRFTRQIIYKKTGKVSSYR